MNAYYFNLTMSDGPL